jgi:hypothetical protein
MESRPFSRFDPISTVSTAGMPIFKEPISSISRWLVREGTLRRLVVHQVGKILMGTLIVGAWVALSRLAPDTNHPAHEQEPSVDVEARRVIRSEVRHIWLPETLIELKQRGSPPRFPETHAELCRVLKLEKLESVWYALTMRGHHAGGGFSDVTVVRRPYDESLYFAELLGVVATAAGDLPNDPESDFSTATIQVIAREASKRAPLEVMAELAGQRRTTEDLERYP